MVWLKLAYDVAEDTHISRGFHNRNAPVRGFLGQFMSVKRKIRNAGIAASSSYAYTYVSLQGSELLKMELLMLKYSTNCCPHTASFSE